jgi:hypothetical protein
LIYIFDGPDLAGKTYLANKISELAGIPIVKKPFNLLKIQKDSLKSNDIELYTHFFWESLYPVGSYYPLIYDRSLLSSLVFSKMFNRTYPLDYVYKYLHDEKVKIFLITADSKTLEERIHIRDEKFFNLEEIIRIQDLFINFGQKLKENGSNIYWIDNSKENERNSINECFKTIQSSWNPLWDREPSRI